MCDLCRWWFQLSPEQSRPGWSCAGTWYTGVQCWHPDDCVMWAQDTGALVSISHPWSPLHSLIPNMILIVVTHSVETVVRSVMIMRCKNLVTMRASQALLHQARLREDDYPKDYKDLNCGSREFLWLLLLCKKIMYFSYPDRESKIVCVIINEIMKNICIFMDSPRTCIFLSIFF